MEELRIGSFEGPDEYIFGRISYLAVGPQGSIYVADAQLETVRVYDANGRFLRSIGRKGEAPGEYLMITGMTALPNGNLAIYDARNQRITVFQPDGKVVWDTRILNSLFMDDMLHHDVISNLYLQSMEPQQDPRGGDSKRSLIKVSSEGNIVGHVPLPEENKNEGMVLITPEGAQFGFSVSTLWAWNPLGYLVVGRNDDYSFEMRKPDAEPLRVQKPFDPVAVNSEERAEWLAWAAYFRKQDAQRGQPATNQVVPHWKPAFKNLYTGDDGRVWVQRYVQAEKRDVPPRKPGDHRPLFSWREPQVFDVFEPDGTFLGTIALPKDTRILARRGCQLWGVHTDDFGEHVVRLRVESR